MQAVGEFSHHGIGIHIKDLFTKYEVNGEKLPTELVNEVNKIIDFDPLNHSLNPSTGDLRSIKTRKCFYKSNYNYEEPVSKTFGFDHDDDSKDHFDYVPILESLKSLYADPNFEQVLRSQQMNKTVMMASLTLLMEPCSTAINLVMENTDAIQLILYQGSFEIANPLGSAKKKCIYILAIYYTLGNLRSSFHSVIECNAIGISFAKNKNLNTSKRMDHANYLNLCYKIF